MNAVDTGARIEAETTCQRCSGLGLIGGTRKRRGRIVTWTFDLTGKDDCPDCEGTGHIPPRGVPLSKIGPVSP